MNRIWTLKRQAIFIFLFAGIIIFSLVIRYKKIPKLQDHYMVLFERWSRASWPVDAKERLRHVIDTYKNKKMDPVPELVYAALSKPVGSQEIIIILAVLDEDEDIFGFTVKEESQDTNGTLVTLEEDYPIFAHCPAVGVVNSYSFGISERSDKQSKNEKLWADHLAMDFDAHMKKQIGPPPPDSSEHWFSKYNQYADQVWQLWESSVPPIYISIPDSDKIHVKIHVYDKAGNVSNTVELDAKLEIN
jgi:hypothetical protein